MSKLEELKKLVKPVADLIDEDKPKFDKLIHDIEFGVGVSDDEWDIISDLASSMLNLSRSGGDTSMKAFEGLESDEVE